MKNLWREKRAEKYLSEDATKVLTHAFVVTSHLDHRNSQLYGIPKYQHDRMF